MRSSFFLMALAVAWTVAPGALAGDGRPNLSDGHRDVIHGAPVNTAKALGDTIYLLGNPYNPDQISDGGIGPQANGTFQDQFGNPGWFGWTHEDETYSAVLHWHVSDFNAVAGDYSMWCGTIYNEGEPDEDHGYGNGWNQNLVFTHQVADNDVASTVNLTATVQVDSEPGYDYTYIEYNADGIWYVWNPGGYDGNRTFHFNDTVTFQPADYTGGGDEIQLRIRFKSDGAWSDEDGLWDTDGACQVDDITVSVNGAEVDFEDFEDQVSQHWVAVPDPGVGDFAALYVGLQDMDDCISNFSAQVAFVDDGEIVPGTGGSPCTTWCYGPGGYIVNNTGGLMGPDFHIRDIIISPPLEWPAGAEAAYIEFDVYAHEEIGAYDTWPGVFYQWEVRSTDSGDPDDLDSSPWLDRGFVAYGGPWYGNNQQVVTDLLVPGRTHVQLGLRVIEYGYNWGWIGTDGTPAPYFDNAKFVAYPFAGPAMAARGVDLFNDNFPASGDLDFMDLAGNAVRLDAALNVAPPTHLVNDPGDSIWCDVAAVRAGSVLNDLPKLFVRMKANPLFDGVRVLPANFVQTGDIVTGWVYGDSTYNANGNLVDDRYNFDLPDDDFFFPGDVLHYYIEAQDNVAGDIGTSLIPSDTTGFSNLDPNLVFHVVFEVRALPTMFSATPGDQPRILFWQDASGSGGENEWFFALSQLGLRQGLEYDMYATNGPSSGVGNGLGGRATSALLDGYDTLLYTSAGAFFTLANGDFDLDPSNDIQVVSNWFARGDRNAFMTGDNLVTGLLDTGAEGMAFVNTYFNVNYVDRSVRELIGNQPAPRVAAIAGNGLIARVPAWIAYGGCPGANSFDAITANAGTTRLAEFTDPNGNAGVYPYAAAIYYNNSVENARVVMMPVDFMFLYNAPGWTPPPGYGGIAARTIILEDILNTFGELGSGLPPTAAPTFEHLTVHAAPNPFNPRTTITLTLPRADVVSVKIYSVRGELVRTLAAERLGAGRHDLVWDGVTDTGRPAVSGVYFCETCALGQMEVSKLTLVR